MFSFRDLVVPIAAAVATVTVVASCGSGTAPERSTAVQSSSATLPAVLPGSAAEVGVTDVRPPVSARVEGSLDRQAPLPAAQTVQLDQPAIWPASDVVLDTPEQAAASFVSAVLGVEPVLGDFAAGDSRSGEIQVFSPGDGGSTDLLERGVLALRMIGPNDGWFVIGASSPGVTISSPETLDRVPASPLTVAGRGRGFEGTLVVRAFRAGNADEQLDQVITQGGPFEALEPYSVSLDLSNAAPGETIAVIVRGDTGLDGDPGDFASIPVVISDPLPETR